MKYIKYMEIYKAIREIKYELGRINTEILNIKEKQRRKVSIDNLEIYLPDHLRKTYLALRKIGKATAMDVAMVTKRSRAVESGYLNTLNIMDVVKKEKESRKTIFKLRGEVVA